MWNKSLVMNKVCFLGSGGLLLERAKLLGLEIILVHDGKNVDRKCLSLSDCAYLCDLQDNKKKILNFLKSENVDTILTLSEKFLELAAWLNDRLNGGDYHTTLHNKLKNKVAMRETLSNTKLNKVKFVSLEINEDVRTASNQLDYPFILKPTTGVGSNGIYLIEDEEDLPEINLNEPYIAEEFVYGTEYSVEAFSINAKHEIIAVTKKILFGGASKFVEKGHVISRDNNEGELFCMISQSVKEFLDIVGLKNGASHTEIKINENGIHIIESHNRVGGDNIPELVALSTGIDLYDLAIKQASGVSIDDYQRKYSQDSGVMFFDFERGKVKRVYGMEKLKVLPFVQAYHLANLLERFIEKPNNSASRLGYVICTSQDSIEYNLQQASNLIKLEYYSS